MLLPAGVFDAEARSIHFIAAAAIQRIETR